MANSQHLQDFFYPHQVDEMCDELQRGARLGETLFEREERALEILQRMRRKPSEVAGERIAECGVPG